jgi:hypothetical protein
MFEILLIIVYNVQQKKNVYFSRERKHFFFLYSIRITIKLYSYEKGDNNNLIKNVKNLKIKRNILHNNKKMCPVIASELYMNTRITKKSK